MKRKALLGFLLVSTTGFFAWAGQAYIQNVLQIPFALESVTGVSSREPEGATYFSNHRLTFPRKGQIEEVNESFLFSQVSYASFFCKSMVEQDARLAPEKRWAHKNISFNELPSTWSERVVESQMQEYAQMFWQRQLEDDEIQDLVELFHQLVTDLPQTLKSTSVALMGVCSVFGSSFSFLAL